jgi:hypothetical protein
MIHAGALRLMQVLAAAIVGASVGVPDAALAQSKPLCVRLGVRRCPSDHGSPTRPRTDPD